MLVTFAIDLRSPLKASVSVPSLTVGLEVLQSSWIGVTLEVEDILMFFLEPLEIGVRLPA
jgi:hypothetical protein